MPHLRPLAAAAAAVAALVVAPAVASADATVTQFGGAITVSPSTTAPNEVNRITLAVAGQELRIEETGEPAGLTTPPLGGCRRGDTPKVVLCSTSGLTQVTVTLGGGDDGFAGSVTPLAADVNVTAGGGAGNDTLTGGGGPETLNGEAGNDTLDGKGAVDALNGGPGSDTLLGDGGNDTLNGGDDGDVLRGGEGDDTLNGDAGDDELRGEAGNDRMDGKDGADTASYANVVAVVTVALGPGGAETAGNGRLGATPAENDTIAAVENVVGGVGADRLTGNDLPNALTGGLGPDRLDGLEGVDAYFGGPGDDVVTARDGVPEPAIDCQEGAGDELVGDNGADGTAGCEAVAPQLVSPPSLNGDPTEGLTLTINAPGVSGAPLATRNEWHRCAADGSGCILVIAADSYRLTQVDVGKTLFARVIVSNAAGRVTADTPRTAPITDVAGTPGVRPPAPGGRGGSDPSTPAVPRGPAAEITALGSKPKLSVKGKRLRLTAGRRIACRAAVRTCGAEVVATAKLKAKRKKGRRAPRAKTTELGVGSYVVKAGETVDVVFRLKKSARKKLPAGRRVTITLKITVIQSGSDDVTQRVKLKVKVPRARKR